MKYLIILFISILFYTPIANAQAATTGSNDDYYATNVNDVTDGLVLWWPGRHQGLNYAQDVSSYRVQGTITSASWGTGTGRGLYFDGVNDNVSFGDPADGHLDFGTSDFSISFWIKTNKTSADLRGMFAIDDAVSDRFFIATFSNALYCWLRIDGVTIMPEVTFGTTNIADNTWKLITQVYDRDGSATCYVNSILQPESYSITAGSSSIFTNNSQLFIGRRTIFYFDGYIDDVRNYNRALSSDEINRIYVSNPH